MILCWNGQAPCFLFSSVRVRSCAEHVPPKKPPERSPSKPSPTGHYGLALNNFGVAHARCGAVVCSLRPWIACLCPRLGSHRLAVGGCQTAFGRAPEAPRYRQGYPLPASDAASPSPSTTASRFPRNTSTFAADRYGPAFRTPPRRRQHRRELDHSNRRDVYQEGRWQSCPPPIEPIQRMDGRTIADGTTAGPWASGAGASLRIGLRELLEQELPPFLHEPPE